MFILSEMPYTKFNLVTASSKPKKVSMPFFKLPNLCDTISVNSLSATSLVDSKFTIFKPLNAAVLYAVSVELGLISSNKSS